jgi:hypothetical protein
MGAPRGEDRLGAASGSPEPVRVVQVRADHPGTAARHVHSRARARVARSDPDVVPAREQIVDDGP